MRTTQRVFIVLAALTLMVGTTYVLAQPAPPEEQAEGQLLAVNPEAQTLSIQTASGASMEFRYSDATEVEGAQGGVAGLATATGAKVMVHYTAEGQTNIATRIEVQSP